MSERPLAALVVGGSGDIGSAVAARLGRMGYRVAITGRTLDRVQQALAGLRDAGVDAHGSLCDVTDKLAITRLFEETHAAFGGLDVVVNAAGVCELRSVLRSDESHLLDTLRVNLVGPALVARHALALMRKARRGTIINVTSLGGVEGRKGFGAYSASKGGLIAFSDSLREEAARFGVRVATVCPEKVDTRMHGDDPERAKLTSPSDVAEAVAFLLQLSPTAVVREVRIYNRES